MLLPIVFHLSQAMAVTAAQASYAEGVRAYLKHDYAAAEESLTRATAAPIASGDVALWLLGQSAAYASDPTVALRAFETLASRSDSSFATLAAWRRADVLYSLGRKEDAKAAYTGLLARKSSGGADRAVGWYRLALMAKGEGAPDHGQALWRTLYVQHPAHPLAAIAAKELGLVVPANSTGQPAATTGQPAESEPNEGETPGPSSTASGTASGTASAPLAKSATPEAHLARARELSSSRRWEEALVELGMITPTAPAPLRNQATFLAGMTRFRMRNDYPKAAELLLGVYTSLPEDDAAVALFHGARALSRSNHDSDAIVRYQEVVNRYPRAKLAAEAQFLSGWLDYNRGAYESSLPALKQLLVKYPRSSFVTDGLWCLGFANYLLGKQAEAQQWFDKLVKHVKSGRTAAKARYFIARSMDAGGTTPAPPEPEKPLKKKRTRPLRNRKTFDRRADDIYRSLAEESPLSWYGLMSRLRLRERGIKLPVHLPPPQHVGKERSASHAGTTAAPPGDPLLNKVDELLAVGLPHYAGSELRAGEMQLMRRFSTQKALPWLLERYRRADVWNRIYQLGDAHGGSSLRTEPTKSQRWAFEASYPLAYRKLVERAQALAHGPPDYVLYAIMRKESGFNPSDVSYADAIGLLQMIPPTTRKVLAALDETYTEDLLYEPSANLRVGAWYIQKLLKKFKGQIPLGAGAYNAGPKAVTEWLRRHGSRPLDEFVELCSYTQTREYMKLVTENYASYLYLYGGRILEPNLKVDVRYIEGDIDF